MRWAIRIALLAALVLVGWVAVVSLRSLGLNNATTWATLAAALAVLAAVASAWTSQRMVELQEDALEPNPVPWIDLRSRYGMAQFRITNHGGSAAYDIRLSWERPLHDAGDRIVTLGIDTPIRVLAPRQSASVLIGIPHMWFSKVSDTTSKGSISFLNASGHRRSTPFTVSAEHERTALVHDDELPKTLYELQKLPDLLEKLYKAVAELSIDRSRKQGCWEIVNRRTIGLRRLARKREIKLWGQPLTRDSSPMQGQAFEVSIQRIYSVLLAEFGGKGERN